MAGYTTRKEIVIDYTKVSATLSNFPVLIKLTNDSDIGGSALSTGYDIRFTSDDGDTLLDYERSYFNITGGVCNAVFHVKIPSLSSTVNTTIYLYYGKADATDGENKTGTWDDGGSNNYVLVSHLNGDPSTSILDSTANANNGTSAGSMSSSNLVDGLVSKATRFDGTDDSINFGNTASLNPTSAFTVELLLKAASTSNSQYLMSHGWNGYGSWDIESSGTKWRFYLKNLAGTVYSATATTAISTTNWQHLTAVCTGTQLKLYVNGTQEATPDITGTFGLSADLKLGNTTAGYSIDIDELLFSNVARSAEYIATRNNNYTTTFSTIGTEEILVTPPVTGFTVAHSLAVTFTDTSTNTPEAWLWNFGDNETSSDQNPTHTYAIAGTYTVVLVATNAGGSDTYTFDVTVSDSGGSTTVTTVRIFEMDHKIGTTQKHAFQIAKSDNTGYSNTCTAPVISVYVDGEASASNPQSWTISAFDNTMSCFWITVPDAVDSTDFTAGQNIDINISCTEGDGNVFLNIVGNYGGSGTGGNGHIITDYTFDPTANTITITEVGYTTIKAEQILSIFNTATGTWLYNSETRKYGAEPGKPWTRFYPLTSVTGGVITYTAPDTGATSDDVLQILVNTT